MKASPKKWSLSNKSVYLLILSLVYAPYAADVSGQLSPNKKYVALIHYKNEYGLFLKDTNDGKIERHVLLSSETLESISHFIWSPNSRYVAFAVCNQIKYPKRAGLFIRDIDAKTHYKVDGDFISSVGTYCYLNEPFWAPDSSRVGIVEHDDRNYVNYRISLFKPDGQKIKTLKLPSDILATWEVSAKWEHQDKIEVTYQVTHKDKKQIVLNLK